jgi:quercetin dioxygenase-like cupin family protein
MYDNPVKPGDLGKVLMSGGSIEVADLPWNAHAKFPGVALKHLITGQDTQGAFSCHIVRVSKGCEIGDHIHEGKWELHEVVSGQGTCLMWQQELAYHAGVSVPVPPDTPHRVIASKDEDLYIAAKFIPALL